MPLTPYIVSYSFAGFQANNPTTPLPGASLDNELAGAATAVASLIEALSNIRRSDGTLQNGVVTFDSFELGLKLLLDPTNGLLVAAAVADAEAAAVAAGGSATSSATSAAAALASAIAAAASAAGVNLSLYLPKAGNLAGLGSVATARNNLGLGSVVTFNTGSDPYAIVQLDENSKLYPYDGSRLFNIDTVPVGVTIWVNDTAAPTGFVKENGALLSRATFPRLWAFAAASANIVSEAGWAGGSTGSFSSGDLTTTFRVPDARGEFIRAYDDGRGVDAGRAIGLHQADENKAHTHAVTGGVNGATSTSTAVSAAGVQLLTASTAIVISSQGTESRPRNNAKLACIKY